MFLSVPRNEDFEGKEAVLVRNAWVFLAITSWWLGP